MNPINTIVDYVRSSIAELKKVSWPTKSMTIRYSSTVIVACLALAAFFGALDFGFSRLVSVVLAHAPAASAPAQPAPTPVIPDLQPTVETSSEPITAPAPQPNQPIQINPTTEGNGPIQTK
ncbi:MAG: preprotein translocase subunit SecE [Patescibacteria group bacterium]